MTTRGAAYRPKYVTVAHDGTEIRTDRRGAVRIGTPVEVDRVSSQNRAERRRLRKMDETNAREIARREDKVKRAILARAELALASVIEECGQDAP